MTNKTALTIEIDSTLMNLANVIFTNAGMTFDEAVERFLDATVACREIPFDFEIHKPDTKSFEGTVPAYCKELEDVPTLCDELDDFVFDDIEDEPETIIIRITFDKVKSVWKSQAEMLPELMFESGSLDALIERCRLTLPEVLSTKEYISNDAQVMFSVEKLESLEDITGKGKYRAELYEDFEWVDSFDDEEW